jgi:predicted RNase H-like HicB family nuclease
MNATSNHGYVALIHPPEGGSEWGVTFPDVPGCVTGGDTFEDAVAAAREALSGHLAALRADCEPLPEGRSMIQFLESRTLEDAAGLPQLIFPRHLATDRVRVNITISKAMLRQADETAEARGLTRSALIESALASVIDA